MSEHVFDLRSSESKSQSAALATGGSPALRRNAFLITGASAIAFGLWKGGRMGWPTLIGGLVLLARGIFENVPRELSCELTQTINRSPSEVYACLREVKNWPGFVKGMEGSRIEEFQINPPDAIRWSQGSRQWGTQITSNSPDKIQWSSEADDRTQYCSAELRPAPGNRGTEVRWRVRTSTPQNMVGLVRRGSGTNLEQKAREALRVLKQLLETGEVATTDGQPHGRRGTSGRIARVLLRESVDEEAGRREPRPIAPQRAAS